MTNNEKFEQNLQQAYLSFLQLDQSGQLEALDRTLILMRKMLRGGNRRKQRLAELGLDDSAARSDSEKSRSKLVRKSNAASPQSPIKPVKTTRKNELRQ
jgi:hypothetical protein